MRRAWVVLPALLLAGLAGQLDAVMPSSPVRAGPSSPNDVGATSPHGVDEVALATAISAARWQCALPHRDRSGHDQLRGPALAAVAYTEAAGTGPADAMDPPAPIPGLGTGPGQNPRADVAGTLAGADDVDTYALPLRGGEILGVTVRGAAGVLEVRDPGGALVQRSGLDRSVIYPPASPLPKGGNATVDHVAGTAGTYTVTVRRGSATPDVGAPAPEGSATPGGDAAIRGAGPPPDRDRYLASVGIFQPGAGAGIQKIFLEFGGARLDITRFGVEVSNTQPAALSPLSSFLANWGLRPSDEPALIQRITATVRENLSAQGVRAEVTDSARDAGAFGRPEVSRVVIGGTAAEAGIATVGISESVDPGNFVREETALVLLDRLSGPADQEVSLNRYLRSGDDRVEFIGRAVGNIASHEAGHFLGSWHTDPDSGRHDLMAPGDIPGAFGFGADELGGTADDTRPKFGQDSYAPAEGFTGTEDTRNRTTVGLNGGADPGATDRGAPDPGATDPDAG